MARNSEELTTPFARDPAAPAPPPMFTAFKAAKQFKMPRWAIPLLTAAAVFHVVLFVTMWVKSIWDVERLAELVYRIGFNPLYRRVWRGK